MSNCYRVCVVDGCENKSNSELAFFKCPVDKNRCQAWKNALGFIGSHKYANITNEQCHNRIRICSLHFDEDSFANSSRNRIHTYAIPSLRLKNNPTRTDDEDVFVPNLTLNNYAQVQTDCIEIKDEIHAVHKDNGIQAAMNLSESITQEGTISNHGCKKMPETEVTMEDVVKFLEANYSEESYELLKAQLNLLDRSPKGSRLSMISLNNSDIQVSQASQPPVDPLMETYPILNNLLQPRGTALLCNTPHQNGTYPVNQIELDHDYEKKYVPGEQQTGNVHLTINLTNHSRGIDVKDICGVILLLKSRKSPGAAQNKPTEIVRDSDVCKTEVVVTEQTIENLDETKPDITLSEPTIQNLDEIKPDVTLSEPIVQNLDETKPDITSSEPTVDNLKKLGQYFQCQSCDKGFLSPHVLKTHTTKYHDPRKKKYKCPSCSKCFISQTMVNRHVKVVHYFKCDYCKDRFETVKFYKSHLKEMHKDVFYRMCKPYFCEQCTKKFGTKETYFAHLRIHTPFVCSICAEGFSEKEEYRAHKDTHPSKFFCPECNKGFKLKESLRAHKDVHNDPFEFICKECNKGFKAKSTLRQHMFSHFPDKNHMCDMCSKMFHTQRTLLIHQKVVHARLKMYPCDQCDRRFAGKANLNQHIRVMHLKVKPYQCEYCGEQFARKDYVTNHCKIHHKSEKPGVVRKGRRRKHPHEKENAPVDCPICGKTLKCPLYLKLHLRSTHARIRKFKCKFCGLMFLHQTSKIRHEKAHEADPKHKYVCPICWKRMETEEQLVAHIEEHDNRPKRHACDVCGETFSRRMLLDNHVDSFHTSAEDLIKKEKEIMDCLTQALNPKRGNDSDPEPIADS